MKSPVILFLFLMAGPFAFGQGAKYIIRNYDLLNEINLNGSTWSMVQDTNGILYFGADYGVVTFNGSEWALYSRNQAMVRSMLCDSRHRIIYGGFNDFGILEPNASAGYSFRSLADGLADSLKVFGDIWSISESDGTVFLQSKTRIFILDQEKISSMPVKDCYHRGFLLNGRFAINQTDAGLTVYDGGSFRPVPGGGFFSDKVISSVILHPTGQYLVGTRKNGVFLFDSATGRTSEPFPAFPETRNLLIRHHIYHGILLPDGNLAFATLFGGTMIISPEGRILKVLNRNHGLRDNVNYFVGTGLDFNLWICTSNGISAFNIYSPFILWDYTSGIDGVVLDIESYRDQVYIGTLTGLYRISELTANREPFQTGAGQLLNSEIWNITRIKRNGEEMLYLGTGSGLYSLRDMIPFLERQGGIVLKVVQLRCNPDVLLALRSDDFDLYRWIDGKYRYQATINNVYNGLRTAGEDEEGYLWIGTRNSGVIRIPIKDLINSQIQAGSLIDFAATKLEKKILDFDQNLTDVIEYEDKALFTNKNGLYTYNRANDAIEKCLMFGPEIANFNKMLSALNRDSNGNIWVGGEDIFLYRPDGTYIPDKLNFQQLKDVFSAFVFLHIGDKKTWIGGNNGVYLYDNKVNMRFPARLRTIITRIEILNDTTLFMNAGHLRKEKTAGTAGDILEPLEIDLAKRNSQVTFNYSLPFFDSERRTAYSYLLEGYSDGWSVWSPEPSVTFSNLKPATYTFKVRGKTIYNQVSEDAEIVFTVPGRWYYSNLAIAAYLAFFVFIVYLAAGYISKSRIRKHLRIEDIIRKRIQESNRAGIISFLASRHLPDEHGMDSGAPGSAGSGSVAKPLTEGQVFLTRAVKTMEIHMGNHDLTAGHFCRELGMSQARVYRKLISLTGMSINEFIRDIRLKKAAQLLLETDQPISEIAYQTGFSSPGYFTKCFTAEFGVNPRDFSQKRK